MGVNGIYGLSGSGLDVESMVKMGMMSKQNQYNKMQQTYTLNEWKKEAYLEIYDKVTEYNNSTLSKYKLSSNMNSRSATSSNSAIKVTASAAAPAMSHTITVNNTATNAYLLGTQAFTSTKLTDLGFSTDDTVSFTLGADSTSVSGTTKHATASFSSTALSTASKARTVLENALISSFSDDGKNLISLDKITVSGDKVNFIGLASGTSVSNNVVSQTATVEAFSITVDDNNSVSGTTNINITYGDLAAILNDENSTFQDFVDLLNKKFSSSNLNLNASYDEAKGFVVTNTKAGSDNTVSFALEGNGMGNYIAKALFEAGDKNVTNSEEDGYTFNVISDTSGAEATLNGGTTVSFTVASDTSVYDLVSKVNTAGTNIRATFDATNNTFSFYNRKTGEANSLAIQANDEKTAALFTAMGLKDTGAAADLSSVKALDFSGTTSTSTKEVNTTVDDGNGVTTTSTTSETVTTFTPTAHIVSGKNASVLLDGNEIKNVDSNSFESNGITYDISNVTSKTSANITVSQDVDKIVDNVKSFVEDYNKLLNDLYDAYRETPNSSYKPLTEAQKNEMTEEQVKKWEEKAKSGMLYHDNTIRSIIDNMRSAVSDSVSGVTGYDSAYKLGISTKGLYGELQLDEDKLRSALADDSDAVYNVFAKLDSKAETASDAKNGIAQRLSGGIGSVLYKATESIKSTAGTSSDINDDSTLNVLLRNLQTRMSNFQAMMSAFEDKLYKKYDAMESALASLGTQMNYVSSMFAS